MLFYTVPAEMPYSKYLPTGAMCKLHINIHFFPSHHRWEIYISYCLSKVVPSRIFISKLISDTLLLSYLTTLDVAELKVDDDVEEGGEDAEVGGGGAEEADVGPGAESGPGLFFLSQSANLAKSLIKQV